VTFGFNGFEFNRHNPDLPVPPLPPQVPPQVPAPPLQDAFLNVCTSTTPADQGCVEKRSNTFFVIVDDELEKENSSIIVWSLTGVGINPMVGTSFPLHNCALVGIYTPETVFDDSPDRKGFGLLCNIISANDWNINYAFIETV